MNQTRRDIALAAFVTLILSVVLSVGATLLILRSLVENTDVTVGNTCVQVNGEPC